MGMENTHWAWGTSARIWCWSISEKMATRYAPHDEHSPRPLQEKATAFPAHNNFQKVLSRKSPVRQQKFQGNLGGNFSIKSPNLRERRPKISTSDARFRAPEHYSRPYCSQPIIVAIRIQRVLKSLPCLVANYKNKHLPEYRRTADHGKYQFTLTLSADHSNRFFHHCVRMPNHGSTHHPNRS